MKTDLLHVSARTIRFREDMKKNTKATSLKVYEPIAPNFGLYRKRPQRVSTLKRVREMRDAKNFAEEIAHNDETKTYEDSYGRYSICKRYFVEIGQWRYIKRYVVDLNATGHDYMHLSLNQQCLTAAFKTNYNSSKYLAFFTADEHGTTEQFINLLVRFCEIGSNVNHSDVPFWKTPWRRNLWLPNNFQ